MPSDLLLPVFPLEVVLLPGEMLPLHIFEERYKVMIGEAIQHNSEFGIVLYRENALANTGCSAVVEKVVRRYPDGRLDIVTEGRRRFEVLFVDEQKPFLQAGVLFFEDDPDTAPDADTAQHLADLFQRVVQLMPTQVLDAAARAKELNSFAAAGILPLDLDLKQKLLTSRSEAERVTVLAEYFEALLPRLKRARRIERSARGNGHG